MQMFAKLYGILQCMGQKTACVRKRRILYKSAFFVYSNRCCSMRPPTRRVVMANSCMRKLLLQLLHVQWLHPLGHYASNPNVCIHANAHTRASLPLFAHHILQRPHTLDHMHTSSRPHTTGRGRPASPHTRRGPRSLQQRQTTQA